MITRNILEPKLLSASLELSQLSVLIAIFVGLNAGGLQDKYPLEKQLAYCS